MTAFYCRGIYCLKKSSVLYFDFVHMLDWRFVGISLIGEKYLASAVFRSKYAK